MTTIVENASIVTQDKDDDFIESDDIGIVANRISAMGVGFAANHKAEPYCFIDSTGKFAIPGLSTAISSRLMRPRKALSMVCRSSLFALILGFIQLERI